MRTVAALFTALTLTMSSASDSPLNVFMCGPYKGVSAASIGPMSFEFPRRSIGVSTPAMYRIAYC